MAAQIIHADCLDAMAAMAEASIDAIVTDPPYGLEFMGKHWDRGVPGVDYWRAALRVLKPGGHIVSFGGTRTYHRMACAIEDAGFVIRDQLQWLYGSGFPKSHNVGKAIDAALGVEREIVAEGKPVKRMIPGADQNKNGWLKDNGREFVPTQTIAGSDDAAKWEGWGTALKPACEPIVLARKPLIGTVAANVLEHGTGALNIDACRVGVDEPSRDSGHDNLAYSKLCTCPSPMGVHERHTQNSDNPFSSASEPQPKNDLHANAELNDLGDPQSQDFLAGCHFSGDSCGEHIHQHEGFDLLLAEQEDDVHKSRVLREGQRHNRGAFSKPCPIHTTPDIQQQKKRWPANVIHDGSEEVLAGFPDAPGQMADVSTNSDQRKTQNVYGAMRRGRGEEPSADSANEGTVGFKMKPGARRGDSGSAARFFYCAKASAADRDDGLEDFEVKQHVQFATANGTSGKASSISEGRDTRRANTHPTVKPTALMRWLCRLVTPPGGIILDPFCGSGSTGRGAVLEGFGFIGIEREAEYVAIAQARIQAAEDTVVREAASARPQLNLFTPLTESPDSIHQESAGSREPA